jgi:hypothetical protein
VGEDRGAPVQAGVEGVELAALGERALVGEADVGGEAAFADQGAAEVGGAAAESYS